MPTPLNEGQGAGYVGPQMREVLRRYGLHGLESWMSMAIIKGWSEDEIMLHLYDTQAFKNRFPGIFELSRKGRNPISPEEYLQYETTARNLTQMIGLRISQSEIDALIGNSVAVPELEERVGLAAAAVYETDVETRRDMMQRWGITEGDMMRYWLNPKEELPRLQQQFRMSEIAGSARRVAYGGVLTDSQAERLASTGMTREQAVQAFTSLDLMAEVFKPLDEVEANLDQDTQISYIAGNTDVAKQVEKRVQRRLAQFMGGGEFVTGQDELGNGRMATGSAR